MADNTHVQVRKASEDDLQDIIGMIQELADFEKMSDGPTLKVEDLVRDGGFGGNMTPFFHSFVIEVTNTGAEYEQAQIDDLLLKTSSLERPLTRFKTVGYALCFFSYSTWEGKSFFLEDLYVKPQYRGLGYGKLMYKEVVKYALDNSCSRLDFHVLAWNPAKQFYNHLGAMNLTKTEEWEFYRLNRQQMDELLT